MQWLPGEQVAGNPLLKFAVLLGGLFPSFVVASRSGAPQTQGFIHHNPNGRQLTLIVGRVSALIRRIEVDLARSVDGDVHRVVNAKE
jgi:hypothetical protein